LFAWLFGKEDWCCPAFRKLHEDRYGRKLFVFARPPGWGATPVLSFWLAFRSVRHEDLQRPLKMSPSDVPITISTCERVLYCPFCGANLEQVYGGREAELVDPVIFREFELPAK
jgi:hypothetical protein